MDRLSRYLLWQRLKSIVIVSAIIGPLLALVIFLLIKQTQFAQLPYTELRGTLLHHTRVQNDEGSHVAYLRVRLEDGKEIRIRAYKPTLPPVGTEITLLAHQLPSGKMRYSLPFNQ